MNIQNLLNSLVGQPTTIRGASFGWASLLRYGPHLDAVFHEMNGNEVKYKQWLDEGGCYVFEIGKNGGDVFSANMVQSVNITSSGVEIILKG